MTNAKVWIGGAWQNVTNRAGSSRQGGAWVAFGPAGGATSRLITSQTPGIANVNEAQNVTLATTVYFSKPGTITGVQFFTPTTLGAGTFTAVVYSVDTDDNPAATGTGTLLSSQLFSGLSPGVLSEVALASPVTVSAGNVAYRVGVRTTEGRYAVTSAFFNSAALTSGDITAPQTGTSPTAVGQVDNGSFIESVSTYPNKTFNGNFYFTGPVFVAS